MGRDFSEVAAISHLAEFRAFLSISAPDADASASLALCFSVESVMEGDYALISARSG
jgi:hypothetical protein